MIVTQRLRPGYANSIGANDARNGGPPHSWSIQRDRGSASARATSTTGTTLQGLADLLGLTPCQFARWARLASHGCNPHRAILENGTEVDERELTLASQLWGGQVFQVPNTVVMFWIGDGGAIGKALQGWSRHDRNALTNLGFHVKEIDAGVYLERYGSHWPARALEELADLGCAGTMHGFFAMGHGSPCRLGFGGLQALLGCRGKLWYGDIHRAIGYDLALVIINACNGGWSIRDPGMQSLGGRDLVSASPAARFAGLKRYFVPQLGLRLDYRHVNAILRKGEQGTGVLASAPG